MYYSEVSASLDIIFLIRWEAAMVESIKID